MWIPFHFVPAEIWKQFFVLPFVSLSWNNFIQMKFRQIWNKQQQQKKQKQSRAPKVGRRRSRKKWRWRMRCMESFHFGFWFAQGVIITTRSVNSPWTLLKSLGSWSGNQTPPPPPPKKNNSIFSFLRKEISILFLRISCGANRPLKQ